MIRLKRLIHQIPGLEVYGSKEVMISGICSNSKLIAPGNLFVAKKGAHANGAEFIPDVLAGGAQAVLTNMHDPFLSVPHLVHSDVPAAEAKLAAEFYHHPSKKLDIVGVTGTNGKTTTSYLIKHMLDRLENPAGLIGTIEWIVGHHSFREPLTTPDVITNHKLLKEMVGVGCKSAVLEVTSHALVQRRVAEIAFDVALFTNLSQDHLDYHGTMDSYLDAKALLFEQLEGEKIAIVNANDPASQVILARTKGQPFSYGIDCSADLIAKEVKFSEKGSQFICDFRGEERGIKIPLLGSYNVSNYLGAVSAGLALGYSMEKCIEALKYFKGVPARLEKVKNSLGIQILVDFAHTPAALENVLQALSPIKQRRLTVVFGGGGGRDQDKRSLMGKAVSGGADRAIITNDNPRKEDPQQIASQIQRGFPKDFFVEVILDREKAICRAIDTSQEGDIILIAGKGHEKEQIFAHTVVPFDDVAVAEKLCRNREEEILCDS